MSLKEHGKQHFVFFQTNADAENKRIQFFHLQSWHAFEK